MTKYQLSFLWTISVRLRANWKMESNATLASDRAIEKSASGCGTRPFFVVVGASTPFRSDQLTVSAPKRELIFWFDLNGTLWTHKDAQWFHFGRFQVWIRSTAKAENGLFVWFKFFNSFRMWLRSAHIHCHRIWNWSECQRETERDGARIDETKMWSNVSIMQIDAIWLHYSDHVCIIITSFFANATCCDSPISSHFCISFFRFCVVRLWFLRVFRNAALDRRCANLTCLITACLCCSSPSYACVCVATDADTQVSRAPQSVINIHY